MARAGAATEKVSRKTFNREIGQLGESAAARELLRLGYRVLQRNYSCPAGEVDIIAEHRGMVVFVEVKTRSPRARFSPEDAVDERKRGRIRAAAKYYLSHFREASPRRFDVVSVMLDAHDRVVSIEVTEAAFAE